MKMLMIGILFKKRKISQIKLKMTLLLNNNQTPNPKIQIKINHIKKEEIYHKRMWRKVRATEKMVLRLLPRSIHRTRDIKININNKMITKKNRMIEVAIIKKNMINTRNMTNMINTIIIMIITMILKDIAENTTTINSQ